MKTNNIFVDGKFYFDIAIRDYAVQPWNVTINNIVKEFPVIFPYPEEAMITSGVKVYFVAEVVHVVAPALNVDAKELKGDSTHKGQFVQNAISGTKNTVLWYYNVPRGTKKHELDRPFADFFLKGGCKLLAMSTFKYAKKYAIVTNSVCESTGHAFLTGTENIWNKGLKLTNITAWMDEIKTPEFLVDSIRKGVMQSVAAKITMDWFIHPAKSIVGKTLGYITPDFIQKYIQHDYAVKDIPYVSEMFSQFRSAPYIKEAIDFMSKGISNIPFLGGYINKAEVLDVVVLPDIANYAVNVATGVVIVPIVRSFTYTVNRKVVVLMEYDGEVSCSTTGDFLDFAKRENITIEYKYDAHMTKESDSSTHYSCVYKKNIVELDKNLVEEESEYIIIHYPEEDNFVGRLNGVNEMLFGAVLEEKSEL